MKKILLANKLEIRMLIRLQKILNLLSLQFAVQVGQLVRHRSKLSIFRVGPLRLLLMFYVVS